MDRMQKEGQQGVREFRGSVGTEEGDALRELFRDFSEAVKAKDVDKIMSFYAPDIVAFDIVPPLQFTGRDEYRKSWERFLSAADAISTHELKDLNITASDDVAFAHSLVHMVAAMKDGEKMDCWMRLTCGFCKMDGRWLVTHEQLSVPADMESGQAQWDLKPDERVH